MYWKKILSPCDVCFTSDHNLFLNALNWRLLPFWRKNWKNASFHTGKSLSEFLIFASTNPQYDERLFIELQVQYMTIPSSNLGRTCCVQKLTFRKIFVHNMFSPFMYCKKKTFWQRFTCTVYYTQEQNQTEHQRIISYTESLLFVFYDTNFYMKTKNRSEMIF